MAGSMDVVIAGGVESMSRVPMFMPSALPEKSGFGSYMSPRMRKRYPGIEFSQFIGAEMIAEKYNLTKDDLDAYALKSHLRAIEATSAGRFADEIVARPLAQRRRGGRRAAA